MTKSREQVLMGTVKNLKTERSALRKTIRLLKGEILVHMKDKVRLQDEITLRDQREHIEKIKEKELLNW